MRPARLAVLVPLLVAGSMLDGRAGVLDETSHEWSFGASFTDTDDAGSFTRLDLQYQFISPAGRHEIGALFSYENADFDERPAGSDEEFDALLAGPVYTWNWTPRSESATGFLEFSVGVVGANLGDSYGSYLLGALGMKTFVGDSVAVGVRLFRQELAGEDGVDDQTSTGLGVGISFFTGHRPAGS